ncbi:plastid lipid-associated protein/fibrillin conserved domain-containing protein, partial [Pavlovales sp. CCMP2436]
LAKKLEAINPTRRPLASDKLSACWRLLYTTSDAILGMPRPLPFQPRPRILQHISVEKLAAKNEEWVLGGILKNSVVAQLTPRKDGRTVDVGFKQFRIGWVPVNVDPAKFRGVLETTYLDDDLRISRGDKGNLFVLAREGP